ncbi:DEAD/DEAH box helicase [Brachybacterium sp. AOP25-B2-12]|uniref:DEAD/DEAH box helicase n=1 Tax=Brachybacterium sp. AOP25-B2-12 TaxID=3457710 RepID=UPI004034D00D
MPLVRLDLVLDGSLGIAVWARERTDAGRSRPVGDLSALLSVAPPALAEGLTPLTGTLRHRAVIGTHRVPARAVSPSELTVLLGAVRAAILVRAAELGTDAAALLERLGADGAALALAPELVAMPGLLAAVRADDAAIALVEARHVRPVLDEHADGVRALWRGLDGDGDLLEDPLLDVLVDHRCRAALWPLVPAPTGAPAAAGPAARGAELLAALTDPARRIGASIPVVRRIGSALDAYLASARARVRVGGGELELVVRLHEPPLGAAWPLQTCLRETDGTVHPVADLRAVGDLTAAGAAEAAGTILRHAPTLRTAQVDPSGTDWLLSTREASDFLTLDAPLLDAAGVTAMLPRNWTARRTSVRAEVTDAPPERTGPSVGLQAMMSFRWKVAVGETELTDEEIEEIRAAQGELVQLRGSWVRLDQATLKAAERFLDAFSRSSGGDGAERAARARAIAARPEPSPRAPASGTGFAPLAGDEGEAAAAGTGAGSAEAVVGSDPAGTAARGDLSLRDWLALLASAEADGVEIGGTDVDGEIARLVEAHAAAPAVPEPTTLAADLRPYQRRGLDWMWFLDTHGLGGILADDMGLGKTMQVLALLCREREQAGERAAARIGPTLLVCPMSVVGSWQREAERFAPHLRVHVHHGQDRVRDVSFLDGVPDVDLVLTTYALLSRDLPLLQRAPWHRLVLDEAQHVKNPGTAVSRAARALPAARRLALTGTPVENRLTDLHALMDVVNPGLLGSPASFQERIAGPIEAEGEPGAVSRLRRLTAPFVLRRVKTDRTIIADLPVKTEITQSVNLTPEQAGLYEALVHEMLAQLDGADENQRRSLVVSTITRLKQVCNHPAHYLQDGSAMLRDGRHRSGKLELVDDLLASAFEAGEKVLLFTQFTTFGHLLVPYWEETFGMQFPFLHGGVSKPDRDAMVADFQEQRDAPGAMLLSLRAGGTGLTLTAANHVVHLDRWWNPAVENQATDRAFRIGQRRDVQVRKLVSAGTVEERIDQVLTDKSQLADLAVGTGEGWIAQLEDADLARLFALDPDQVDEGDLSITPDVVESAEGGRSDGLPSGRSDGLWDGLPSGRSDGRPDRQGGRA